MGKIIIINWVRFKNRRDEEKKMKRYNLSELN